MNNEKLYNIKNAPVKFMDSYVLDGIEFGYGGFDITWLTSFISNPNVIFDIGCYDCGDSIRFKQHFPNCEIYSFEASPRRYEMTKNVADRYKINLYNKAVSDEDGTKEFYDSLVDGTRVDAQGSFYKHSNFYKERNPRIIQNITPILVPTITIDSFCKSKNIKDIDLLHVDVEGAEMLVIKGMKDIRPKVIYVETLDIIDNKNNPSWIGDSTDSLKMEKYLLSNGYILGKILSADRLYFHNSII